LFRFKSVLALFATSTRWLSALVIGLALPVFNAEGAGREAAPYGEDFAREGAAWPEGGPVLEAPPMPDASADAEDFAKRLDALEIAEGPYGPGLAELLTDTARFHESRGDYEQALSL